MLSGLHSVCQSQVYIAFANKAWFGIRVNHNPKPGSPHTWQCVESVLAVSISILGSSLPVGAIDGASYSTQAFRVCNVPLFIIIAFLTITFRRQKARIRYPNTPSLLGFLRCGFFSLYTPTLVVAVHTIDWSIAWCVCGGWGYRRHLQTRRKRPSHGHIHFSTLFYFIVESGI